MLASLYKQSDILIHTGDSFDVGAQGFSLLQDGQTEKGSGKPAGPLFEWKQEVVAAKLDAGILISPQNHRDLLIAEPKLLNAGFSSITWSLLGRVQDQLYGVRTLQSPA